MIEEKKSMLCIGWASRDITPDQPVLLRGQFHARVSEGVMDPLTVTALALESVEDGQSKGHAIMVSCDIVGIPDCLREAVRARIGEAVPDLEPRNVCLNAIHTHNAPETRIDRTDTLQPIGSLPPSNELSAQDLGVMEGEEYAAFLAARIADAVLEAWQSRAPGGIGFGLGHAVVGLNRRVSYFNGETHMYGKTDDPDFSHLEGGTDHSVNLLCTWNKQKELTGVVVNVACPSQVSEMLFQVSADYWHDTRVELRQRLGNKLFILAQCSAAGDQSPHIQIDKPAEERMLKLAGRTQRQDIAIRIADAVMATIPLVKEKIDWNPVFAYQMEVLDLPLRTLSEEDVKETNDEAAKAQAKYESLLAELETKPDMKKKSRWYVSVTHAYNKMLWNRRVERRFQLQQTQPTLPVEIHILRLGDMVFATNSLRVTEPFLPARLLVLRVGGYW